MKMTEYISYNIATQIVNYIQEYDGNGEEMWLVVIEIKNLAELLQDASETKQGDKLSPWYNKLKEILDDDIDNFGEDSEEAEESEYMLHLLDEWKY